jgi:hypothetical protein
VILGLRYPLRLPLSCADLRHSRFQVTNHEPIGEQSHEKNDRGEFKAWNIGAVRGDQESHCEWCDDSREIACEVLSPGPYADVFRWRARLKDCEQVARSKPYQRSLNQQPNSGIGMRSTHRSDEKHTHTESHCHDSFASRSFIPTATYQCVGNPSANRFGNTKREEHE